jgi:hypothetical protein
MKLSPNNDNNVGFVSETIGTETCFSFPSITSNSNEIKIERNANKIVLGGNYQTLNIVPLLSAVISVNPFANIFYCLVFVFFSLCFVSISL